MGLRIRGRDRVGEGDENETTGEVTRLLFAAREGSVPGRPSRRRAAGIEEQSHRERYHLRSSSRAIAKADGDLRAHRRARAERAVLGDFCA